MIRVNDVVEARHRITPYIHKTPMITSRQIDYITGNRVFLKSEHLQKTGSFKIRGATNKMLHTLNQHRNEFQIVTAASSGNHGQAVAYISNECNIKAKIVIPEDATISKVNAILKYNGIIERCGTNSEERLPRAKEIAQSENGIYIPPYDDPFIMAGQGTVGLEILDQLHETDVILVPVGGGGLISGILTAIKEKKPSIQVIGVEPKLANDTFLSFQQRKHVLKDGTKTIADGLRTSKPGSLTFPVLLRYLDDMVLVSEEEIKKALTFVMERLKQVIEPSSATVIAALLYGNVKYKNKNIIAVLSGGNIDLQNLHNILSVETSS
ncbi:threonine ammonia-lyase [Salirhabdus salicampi]|uniref:threonine ammonia-lyase n=1 Tax=Salirhabdus salicampi TaxID=476102 RepID=UPI0020C2B325|nr:threonine/serine dehydratase [Salirhabdus salicampi]MCP8616127.1 threonine/serine dehydratase [Salirhabdus salicampi]